jgi:ribosomal protein S6--L-glutamate ligase
VLTDGARPDLAEAAIRAAQVVGLRLAAVDLFEMPNGPAVIEVNSNPMIATLEDHDRWDLIVEIWRANFAVALR